MRHIWDWRDEKIKNILGRPLDHPRCPCPYLYLVSTYLHGHLGRNMQVVKRAVVVVIGTNPRGYREVLGIAVGFSEPGPSGGSS